MKREEHFKFLGETEILGRRKRKDYQLFCLLNGKTYSSIVAFRNVLRGLGYSDTKEYYDNFYKSESEGVCEFCDKETIFLNLVVGYSKRCGKCDDCRKEKNDVLKEAASKEEVKAKKVKARKEALESNPDLMKNAAKKARQTKVEKYGSQFFSDITKKQWENRSSEEIESIVEKTNETKRRNGTNTGGEHFQETGKKISLNGSNYFVQGFEDAVIKCLAEEGVEFLMNRSVPRIETTFCKSGKSRPDIFIPSMNMIIEVKSNFTLSVAFDKISDIGKNALEKGFSYVVFCLKSVSKDRTLLENDRLELIHLLNMTISSQALGIEKVQRLSRDWEYRPIVFGSGSAQVPKEKKMSLEECDIVCSAWKHAAVTLESEGVTE